MELVLDKQKTGRKRKSRLQERFDKLRSKLERQQRQNERFQQDLDELVNLYHQRSQENDKFVFDDLVALTDKLIVFASRKSLSDWHRDDLDDWLRGLIERRIQPLDAEVAERLRARYQQAIAHSMDISVEELMERVEVAREAFEQEFEQEFDEAESASQASSHKEDPLQEDLVQEDLFGFDDIEPEAEAFDGDPDDNEPDWMNEEQEDQIGRNVMDGSWAKDLFRRAAQALHPDRELDPEQRQHKQERMRDLLKARKHGDIMAMLTIYSESVGDADIVVAEQEMTAVCDALEGQLEALEFEQQEYIHSHPSRHLVFQIFYHRSKKERAQRIREWEQDLKHEKQDLRDMVAYLRNLTRLKSVLEDRRGERSAVLADIVFEDIGF